MIKREFNVNNINTIVYNMIENNDINNILEYKIINDTIIYNIDGKVSLKEIIGKKVDSKQVIDILKKITNVLSYLESYMITCENIYLILEDIYTNDSGDIFLMINPSIFIDKDIKTFFQEILINRIININDKSTDLLKINNYFNSSKYSIFGLLKMLNNIGESSNLFNKENEISLVKEAQVDNVISNKKESFFSKLFSSKDNNIIKQKNI